MKLANLMVVPKMKSNKITGILFDNHIPRVVREPNTASRYCNQGYNLLGYIVEKVSGISYEEYINKNILEPLKMENSLVRLKIIIQLRAMDMVVWTEFIMKVL